MDEKLAQGSLVVFIIAILFFIVTFSQFMLFKERVCSVDLNSPSCGEKYPTFLHDEFSLR